MQLKNYKNCQLTYCTNIHPGETWADHYRELKRHLPELKQRLSPDDPFGVGLRVSAQAAGDLLKSENLREFKHWLDKEHLFVFTINGFPFGSFHRQKVKDTVYKPDWGSKQRLDYTLNLVQLLAELLPDHLDGGISTSPVTYKYWQRSENEEKAIVEQACKHLAECAYQMHLYHNSTGKVIHLDIEPEPDCFIENSRETIHFFKHLLWPKGSEYLQAERKMDSREAVQILKNHIRVCYDTCHFAVEYEVPEDAVRELTQAGIRIGKTQISAALKVDLGSTDKQRIQIKQILQQYVESTYLHQVVEKRTDGTFHRYRDLPEALTHLIDSDAIEWRIHFHVPVFTGQMDLLNSTQDHIIDGIEPVLTYSDCRHFEIETYTWEVLPEPLKMNITDSIEREYRWVLNQFDKL